MKPAPFRPRALRLLRRQRQGAVSRSRSVTVWEFRQKQDTGLRLPWKAHSLGLAYAVTLAWPREGRQPGTRGAGGSDPVRSCARPAAQSPRLTARCPCHLRQSASIFKLLRDIWSRPKHPRDGHLVHADPPAPRHVPRPAGPQSEEGYCWPSDHSTVTGPIKHDGISMR